MADSKAPDDLTTLSKLDETDLLVALKTRYENDKIYTYVGDILIAVNPFKDIPIFGKDVCKQYMFTKSRCSQPPHIYALADLAYQSMLGRRGLLPANQCILISGESGAGKTESTKFLLRQLMELCSGNTQLEQQILQVNPLLEAFGNAQTLMNDNSSRFGKYIQLTFHKGQVLGAKISEYLLEKSRLVQQEPGEENFHVFYYMFAGKTAESLEELYISPQKPYRYLVKGITPANAPKSRLKYDELINALELVGFTDEEHADMFTILAGILHLGEVVFSPDQAEAATIKEKGSTEGIAVACSLLEIDQTEVSKCLTSSLTVTRGDHVERNYTVQQAEDVRDAMAKALYGRLFGWIVNKVNQLVGSKTTIPQNEIQQIGILDIFGFEHFEHNSFEQACINLANEQLQLFFNQFVFKQEQEEYTREGIDWTEVKFSDNQHLLNLFLDKPIGILSLLDEECFFPSGTDKSFVDKLNSKFNHLPYYSKSKHSGTLFTISHYAGKVSYSGCNWLEKNRDTFPGGIMNALLRSKNKLIKFIFKAQITRTGSLAFQSKRTNRKLSAKRPVLTGTGKSKVTVGGQFRNSLKNLMDKMNAASPIFVRCLKPNQTKTSNKFDSQYMLAQLLYTGMLETVKIRKEGFAVRASFEEFVTKYTLLAFSPHLPATADSCQNILMTNGLSGAHVGKTKVFLRSHHVDKLTEKMLTLDKSATKIQKVVRGHWDRKRVKTIKDQVRKYERTVVEMLEQVEEFGRSLLHSQELLCQADRDAAQVKKQLSTVDPPLRPASPPPPELSAPPAPHMNILSPSKTDGSFRSKSWSSMREDCSGLKFINPSEGDGSSVGSEAVSWVDSDDSYSDDDFSQPLEPTDAVYRTTPVSVYGWFKETQTRYLLQINGDFPEWFHGIITRRQAEYLLNRLGVHGCFLLRVSQNKFSYCLSFKADDRCRHYMVDQLYNGKFIVVGEAKTHLSLTSLVQYYQKNKISNWDGYLTVPCGQEFTDQKDYEDLIDEKMIAVILQSLKRRPEHLGMKPTEDDGDYLLPQSGFGRNSYLTLLADLEESAPPFNNTFSLDDRELPPPLPVRPINTGQVIFPQSSQEDKAPPVPDRPMHFKQARLPLLPGETTPRSSRVTSDSSRGSSGLSTILEQPSQRS